MSKDFKVKNGLQVTTHITASGVISASGGFVGDGSNITGVSADADAASISGSFNAGVTIGGNISASGFLSTNSNITASGNISSSGTIIANDITLPDNTISGDKVEGGTIASITISQLGGALDVNNENITNIDVNSGAIDGTVIGGASAAAGTFTTLNATSLNVTSITSSIVTSSILQTEGSNIFGDTVADTHIFNGSITASANISASGTIKAKTLDADAITDGLAGIIVAEIDNDEIPIAKLAEDAITIAGTSTVLGGSITSAAILNNSKATVSGSFNAGVTIGGNISSSGFISTNLHITASGNISSSGTIKAKTLDADAITDGLAGVIVAEIDNDEIPIAKLAEDAVTVTAGTGLTGGGAITLGGSATVNVIGGTGVTANANDMAIGQDVATDANVTFNHITASANISSSGTIKAATLDADAISDGLAGVIVAEIDNDEIPIAKLAEDAVTVTAGTGLTGGGSITLGGSATVNVIGGDGITANANDMAITAAQTTIESIYKTDLVIGEDDETQIDFETANEIHFDVNNSELVNMKAGLVNVTGAVSATHITASGDISSSGTIIANDITVAAVTGIDSILATDLILGEDGETKIDFETANEIHFYANNANEMIVQANVVAPGADDGTALGDANQRWSDLFLAEGGVINFDNGDVTITQTNNVLAVAGTTGTSFVGHITASGNYSGSSTSTLSVGTLNANAITDGLAGVIVAEIDNDEIPIAKLAEDAITIAGTSTVLGGSITSAAILNNGKATVSGSFTNGMTVSGNISASGFLSTNSNITASGDISSSGTITAATLDAAAVSDGLAAAIVAEIDNDEIPIAKLAEDAVTVTAGTGLTGGGAITLGGSATVNVIGGDGITANANDMAITAAQTTITSVTNTGLKVGRGTSDTYIDFGTDDKIQIKPANSIALEVETTGIDVTGHITASGVVSASGGFVGDGTNLSNVSATLPTGVVSSSGQINSLIDDTIAATIVGEIDNDEIPIAKLAEDAITIAGTSTALGGSITSAAILNNGKAIISGSFENGMTVSGNISSSGNISGSTIHAQTLDAVAVTDVLAAAVVSEIDNDEIPIAKLAEDAITIAGTSTALGGSITADTIAGQISADTISGNQINGGTIGSVTITQLGGALDVNNENITNIDVNSGAIDGTVIGGASAAAGTFTTLNATSLNVTSITSSIVTSSILQTEGSNIFGDANADTHTFNGSITASANISASGTIKAKTLDADAITDGLAGVIVAEIDNDEIPIAKLAEDAVTVTAGTGLTGGGAITLGGSATVNVIGGDGITANANDMAITAAQTTIESILKTDLVVGEDAQTKIDFETANEIHFDVNNSELVNMKAGGMNVAGHITASGDISASGKLYAYGADFGDQSITNVNQIDLDGFRADAATNVQISLGTSGVDVVMEDGDSFTINSGEVNADFTYFDSGEASLIHGDAALSRVGISDTSPVSKLDVGGDLNVQSHITASGNISSSGNVLAVSMSADAFNGDGSGLSNVSAALPTGVVSSSGQINSLIDDTIAATIVGEIDNDEIPIAKLASDAITIAGTSTVLGGSITSAAILNNGKATVSGSFANGMTVSGNISSSGNISGSTIFATTFDGGAVSDVLAAAVVSQIDNDEIPIAKLAEDAVTVTAGTGLTGGGSITLGGSATVNVIGGDGITANANDMAVTAAQTTITSIFATDLKIGEDDETKIDFEDTNQINFYANNTEVADIKDGGINVNGHITASGNISGSNGNILGFNTITATSLAGTLTTAAQGNVTSLGTLTTLTVDDITINSSTISDAGNLLIDSGDVMTLDADGGHFSFSDNGTVLANIKSTGIFSSNHITASGVISASGGFVGDGTNLSNVSATLPTGVVSSSGQINSLIDDTIAATIVGEIDNDEIPIAKLAEDAVTVTAGTNLSNGGAVTLGGSITLNVDDAFLKNDADDTTSGVVTAGGFTTTGNVITNNITASGGISSSGLIKGSSYMVDGTPLADTADTGTTLNIGSTSAFDRINIGKFNSTTVQVFLPGQVTASGNISSSGQLIAGSADFKDGNITNVGVIDADSLRADAATDVEIILGTSGIKFNAEDGDVFTFNDVYSNTDLQYYDANEDIIFTIDQSVPGVGIGALGGAPAESLDVEGNVQVNGNVIVAGDVIHKGDTDTKIAFTTDTITMTAGNIEMLKLVEGVADAVTINEGGVDVNTRIESVNKSSMLFVDAASDKISIGTNAASVPPSTLTVEGDISASGGLIGGSTDNQTTGSYDFPGAIMGYSANGVNVAPDSYTLTTSYVVFDADINVVFVVPKSGIVEITANIYADGGSSGAGDLHLALSDAASYNSVQSYYENDFFGHPRFDHMYVNAKFVVSGLTAGATIQYWLAAKSDSTSGSPLLRWGADSTNEYPPAILKVTALPSNAQIET